MSNKTYDILNKVQRWLPAAGVLFLTISKIWGLSYGKEINETILAVATFLAASLEISTSVYLKENKNEEHK